MKTFRETFLNEANLTKKYDGFIVYNRKTQKKTKYPYPKGKDNVEAENLAIKDQMDLTGQSRSDFTVSALIPKGEWNTYVSESDMKTVDESVKTIAKSIIEKTLELDKMARMVSEVDEDDFDDVVEEILSMISFKIKYYN